MYWVVMGNAILQGCEPAKPANTQKLEVLIKILSGLNIQSTSIYQLASQFLLIYCTWMVVSFRIQSMVILYDF